MKNKNWTLDKTTNTSLLTLCSAPPFSSVMQIIQVNFTEVYRKKIARLLLNEVEELYIIIDIFTFLHIQLLQHT